MSFELYVPENADYVCLKYSGFVGDEEIEQARVQRNQLAMQYGLMKLLIDIRKLENRPTSSALIQTTVAQMDATLPRLRIALLGSPWQNNDTDFVRTIAVTRNYPLERFIDLDAARSWLSR